MKRRSYLETLHFEGIERLGKSRPLRHVIHNLQFYCFKNKERCNRRIRQGLYSLKFSRTGMCLQSTFHHVTGHEDPQGRNCSLFFNLGVIWGWVINATPSLLYFRERTRFPFYRKLGGSQDLSGRVWKI